MTPHEHIVTPDYTSNKDLEDCVREAILNDFSSDVFDDAPQDFWLAVTLPIYGLGTLEVQDILKDLVDKELASIPTMWKVQTTVVMPGKLVYLLRTRGFI
jgi:hypothetical protein